MAPHALTSEDPVQLLDLKIHAQRDSETKVDNYGFYNPIDPAQLNLESNYGPMRTNTIGYLQPTSADTPLELMRERFSRDGYLFVSTASTTGGEQCSVDKA